MSKPNDTSWSLDAEDGPVTLADAEEATALAEVGGRFEQAWRPEQPPAQFDLYLPPPGSAHRLTVLCDLAVRDLDLRFLHGQAARVEDYLERYPELQYDHPTLLELIQAEYAQRCHREPGTDLEEYLRRFPALAAELAGHPTRLPHVPGFTLQAELGRGGMGVVYKAWQHSLSRTVALKMVRAGTDPGPNELARLRGEAEAVAQLQHPNIVQIYEVGEYDGSAYLALEFVEGGSLEKRLNGTPWPARAAATLVATLARAIDHAHQRGIVHRDLKPANVLLQAAEWPQEGTTDTKKTHQEMAQRQAPLPLFPDAALLAITVPLCGQTFLPKISDFGLAKRLDRDSSPTESKVILGTPNYMAPEQADGKSRTVGPAADLYSLGVILYELLTGHPPFKGESGLDTLAQVRTQEPVPPRQLQPKVPRDLETITLKCLRKEPDRRYSSAAALADDLGRFLCGEPVWARPTPLWERGWRWARRKPLAATFLLTLLACLGGILYLWLQSEAAHRESEEHVAMLRHLLTSHVNVRASWFHAQNETAVLPEAMLLDAEACLTRLLERRSGDQELRMLLADVLTCLVTRRGPEESVVLLEKAARLWEEVPPASGLTPKNLISRATTYRSLGIVCWQQGRVERAVQAAEIAFCLCQPLAEEHPEPLYQDGLYYTAGTLGGFLLYTGHSEEEVWRRFQDLGLRPNLLGNSRSIDVLLDSLHIEHLCVTAGRHYQASELGVCPRYT